MSVGVKQYLDAAHGHFFIERKGLMYMVPYGNIPIWDYLRRNENSFYCPSLYIPTKKSISLLVINSP